MRRLKLIGIGAGNPDYITVQAIKALEQVDVVFVTDKGDDTADLLDARRQVCERYMQAKPYRIVEIRDPDRDRTPAAYRTEVASWHEKRAVLYERAIREQLSEDECGAFLVWGDPSLYDSALRVIGQVAARGTVAFEWEIIPGISSIQALAARHRISLNEIGEPVHITTGRRLHDEKPGGNTNVLVLLDGGCAFKTVIDDDIDIYWGAYLGTPDEILLSGRLGELSEQIETARAQARNRKGWIMDTYLLRKRGAPSC
jgi:precorrin-6A synthase